MMCPHFIILPNDNRQQLSHPTYLTTTTQSLFLFRCSANAVSSEGDGGDNQNKKQYMVLLDGGCGTILHPCILCPWILLQTAGTNVHLGWRAAAESG
eukprot:scaffold26265_cov42-Cyclotella_meneghiniana.AAC.3